MFRTANLAAIVAIIAATIAPEAAFSAPSKRQSATTTARDQSPIIAVPVAQQRTNYWVLPANTEITLTPNSDLSSKSLKKGDTFTFSTVFDVLMNDYIVIPKGTRGQGEVTWRTGKGAFGKSAKMDVSFQWIEVGGNRVVVEGNHRQEGEGNTGATVGAVVAVGVLGAFVTGKSANIPRGMQLVAHTAEPIRFQVAALQAAPQQANIMAAGQSVTQGTSPAVSPVSSSDHNQ